MSSAIDEVEASILTPSFDAEDVAAAWVALNSAVEAIEVTAELDGLSEGAAIRTGPLFVTR